MSHLERPACVGLDANRVDRDFSQRLKVFHAWIHQVVHSTKEVGLPHAILCVNRSEPRGRLVHGVKIHVVIEIAQHSPAPNPRNAASVRTGRKQGSLVRSVAHIATLTWRASEPLSSTVDRFAASPAANTAHEPTHCASGMLATHPTSGTCVNAGAAAKRLAGSSAPTMRGDKRSRGR